MGAIDIINGILIYMYGFDHNPPHIHVVDGDDEFLIYIKDRRIQGCGRSKTIKLINEYIDKNEQLLLALWDDAQSGNEIKKIIR